MQYLIKKSTGSGKYCIYHNKHITTLYLWLVKQTPCVMSVMCHGKYEVRMKDSCIHSFMLLSISIELIEANSKLPSQ